MSDLQQAEAGWLSRSLISARRRIQARFHPSETVRMGVETKLPISDADAAELYADFDARFLAWTGKHLREWKPQ